MLILIVCLTPSLIHPTGSASENPTGQPAVNFYGSITTTGGKKIKVENITIGGKFENITMYKRPKNKTVDPRTFAIYPDLAHLKGIEIQKLPKGKFIYTPPAITKKDSKKIKPQEYVGLVLIYKNGTKEPMLIEAHRRLWNDKRIEGKRVEQKIMFPALRKVVIQGSHVREEEKIKNDQTPSKDLIRTIYTGLDNIRHTCSTVLTSSKKKFKDARSCIEYMVKDMKENLDKAFYKKA